MLYVFILGNAFPHLSQLPVGVHQHGVVRLMMECLLVLTNLQRLIGQLLGMLQQLLLLQLQILQQERAYLAEGQQPFYTAGSLQGAVL